MSRISSTPSTTTLTPAQLALEEQQALAGSKPDGTQKAHGGGHAHKSGGDNATPSATSSLSSSSNTLDGYPTNPFGE